MKKFCFYIFLHCFLTYSTLNAQLAKDFSNIKPILDSTLTKEMIDRKIPGLAYGVFNGDRLEMIGSLGYADVQNKGVVTDSTVFELASITKPFTATAILMLEQQGKLNIEDFICKYLDDCPESWGTIRIKNLLSHTSGLPGLYNKTGFNRNAFTGIDSMPAQRIRRNIRNRTKSFVKDAVRTDIPEFKPGQKYNYSDVGYVVLGIIIDNITGSYREFMQNQIFTPAGMTSTYILDQQTVHPNEARGYSLKNGKLINIMRFNDYEIPSHYGIFSSVIDLQKWDKALNSDLLLNETSKEKAWTAFALNTGQISGYGLGWFIQNFGGKKIISHGGITGTEFIKLVDDSVTVCVLTNLGYNGNDNVGGKGLCEVIARIVDLNMIINEAYVENNGMQLIPIKADLSEKMVGSYMVMGNTVTIEKQKEQHFINAPFGRYELGYLNKGGFIFLGASQEFILKPLDDSFKAFMVNGRIKGEKIDE